MAMKGGWKTMEAILAGIVILLFFAALNPSRLQVTSQEPVNGHRVLDSLYEKGEFRGYVYETDISAIESMVGNTGYLTGYGYSVRICDEGGSCSGSYPEAENVWVYSLIMSGRYAYEPVEVFLYVYRG